MVDMKGYNDMEALVYSKVHDNNNDKLVCNSEKTISSQHFFFDLTKKTNLFLAPSDFFSENMEWVYVHVC